MDRILFRRYAALILVVLAGTTCSSEHSVPDGSREPLLFFAVDGLEWRVMKPLLEQGRLPVMASLMNRGQFGYLDSMLPTLSPVIWTTIATGKEKEAHGILDFTYIDPARPGTPRYYTSGQRRTKAFWNILGDHGLTVHTLGWWMTYPAEAIRGVMVSQTNTAAVLHDPHRALWKGSLLKDVDRQVHPPERQAEVMDLLREVDEGLEGLTTEIFGERPHPLDEFSERMWTQTLWAFRADAVYLRTARELVASGEPFDVAAVYIGGPDVAGHRFWQYAHPEEFRYPPLREQIENFGRLIDDYYVYVDRSIGEIIDAAPEGTTVWILSDHGMHAINQTHAFLPSDPPMQANSGHHLDAPPGALIAAGPHIVDTPADVESIRALDLDTLSHLGGVLDVLPTLLALKAVPLAADLPGRLMPGIIESDRLERFPIAIVPTHDDPEWDRGRQARIADAVDEAERLEQLRALGYIE